MSVRIGIDMGGTPTGVLRLWRFDESDMRAGGTYILRGLKVTLATFWSTEEWKYVPYPDHSKTLECTSRTAIEDVAHIPAIRNFF